MGDGRSATVEQRCQATLREGSSTMLLQIDSGKSTVGVGREVGDAMFAVHVAHQLTPKRLRQITEFIDRHLDQPLSVVQMAVHRRTVALPFFALVSSFPEYATASLPDGAAAEQSSDTPGHFEHAAGGNRAPGRVLRSKSFIALFSQSLRYDAAAFPVPKSSRSRGVMKSDRPWRSVLSGSTRGGRAPLSRRSPLSAVT